MGSGKKEKGVNVQVATLSNFIWPTEFETRLPVSHIYICIYIRVYIYMVWLLPKLVWGDNSGQSWRCSLLKQDIINMCVCVCVFLLLFL